MADEEVTAIRTGVVLTAPTALATPQAPGGAALGPKRRKDGEERVPLGARCARCSPLGPGTVLPLPAWQRGMPFLLCTSSVPTVWKAWAVQPEDAP